jgi:hypothetical protein
MKNPCLTCERVDLDKDKCSITCSLRKEYCLYLGIPIVNKVVSYNLQENKINYKGIPIPKVSSRKKKYDSSKRTNKLLGMYTKSGKLDKAIELMKTGISNREIMRRIGVNKSTVAKLRNLLKEKGEVFYCKCGLEGSHRGWCWYRLSLSRKRQEYLENRKRNAEKGKV